MPGLKLCLLGPFEAALGGQAVPDFRTKKVQALLIFLAVERQSSHTRESLMEMLWPGMPLESAQVNLRQTIYRLRQALPAIDSRKVDRQVPLLLTDRQTVQLNPQASVEVDLDLFQQDLEIQPAQAVAQYRADFLSDFYLVDSSSFEEWAQTLRQKYRFQALATLSDLTQQNLQMGDFVQAQAFAWRQIEIDRLQEGAYRQLMVALAGSGQRSTALQQYQILARRLKEELEIEPEEQTRQLFEQIQADEQRRLHKTGPAIALGGESRMPVFLLTDIERSTELWDTYRHSMLKALMQHNAILEEQIERYGGRILELRGDGVKAVFEAGRPLESVIAIQKAFAEADWEEIGSLKTRIGLHGVPTVRRDFDYFLEDDKYFGPVLNHTARIMSAGWGGQILVSEQVHNAYPLPPGASWIDYGIHELRSLDHPVHIFGLTHSALPQHSYPTLQTLTTQPVAEAGTSPLPPNNLSFQTTQFVGRKAEISNLVTLLAKPDLREVTVVGPGGMGKTRLALALGRHLLEDTNASGPHRFQDGVYFIPLASLNKIKQIVPEISRTLNIPSESSPDTDSWQRDTQAASLPQVKLANYLSSRKMLLILDNFEHLVEGARLVSELLQAAPDLKILVTSRERLQIREEQVFPIAGLEFPDWETPENLLHYTAIELFLQSAHRVQPKFGLDRRDGVFLARISRLVGGMPLGLEIAASWVDTLSVEEIAAEIQKSLDFLESDFRDIPDRHRSIRAIFDTTWNRLDEAEKQIFARLSIFRAPFNRTAAERIGLAPLRTLAALVSKSLLQFDQEKGCYQIHEVLRQYGAEQLALDPQEEYQTRRRHCAFYSQEVDRHVQVLISGKTVLGVELLEKDFANIRAAWDWALEEGEVEFVNQALNGICMYYDWLWQAHDGMALTQTVLKIIEQDAIQRRAEPALLKRLQVRSLAWQAYFSAYFRNNQAAELLEKSELYAQELSDMGVDAGLEQSLVYYFSGLIQYLNGESKKSAAFIEKSLAISQHQNMHWLTIRNLMTLGDIARFSGSLRNAKYWYEKGLAESRTVGNRRGEIGALTNLGWAARNMLDYEEARQYYQDSLDLAVKYKEQWDAAYAYESLGYLSILLGHFDQARSYLHHSNALATKLGQPYRNMSTWVHIGITKWLSGDFEEAENDILNALEVSSKTNPNNTIFPAIATVEFMTIIGRYSEARSRYQNLKPLLREVFVGRFLDARLPRILGWLALAQKDWAEAEKQFTKSIEMYKLDADDEQVAWSQAGLAAAIFQQGDINEAQQLLTEALWTEIELQSFIPLLFTLPVACHILTKSEPGEARRLFAEMQHADFLRKAPLLHDIAYRYLPGDIIKAPDLDEPNSSRMSLNERLWSAASRVLSLWMQPWIEEPDMLPQ